VVGVGAALSLVALVGTPARDAATGSTPLAGSQGTDASLPATVSAVTVSGRGAYANLQVTVNQTQDLVDQAVSVTWKGLSSSQVTFSNPNTGVFGSSYAGNFMQVTECWGDDDATVPSNPGPPPENCEFGGQNFNTAAYPANATRAYTRITSLPSWTCDTGSPAGCLTYTQEQQFALSESQKSTADPTYSPKAYEDPKGGIIYDPFRAVDGTEVLKSVNSGCCIGAPPWPPFGTNPYFSYNTTNEIDFARTFPDGTGQALFSVDTGLQAPGLGCGQAVQKNADGSTSVPKCWLVIVPRGGPVQENPSGDGINQSTEVDTSPLTPWSWANRIAIPLQFNPIGTSCPLGGNVRRIVGSELAAPAASSWQPTLCGIAGNPPYSYASLSDDNARSQLVGGGLGSAGMAVMSLPIDPSQVDPNNPVVYAPLTLSGVAIGFNIERQPADGPNGAPLPDESPLAGTHLTHIDLTPRLVAKLLTESYRGQFTGPNSSLQSYAWLAKNAQGLIQDPDFLQYNPEFAELVTSQEVDDSGLVVEQPSSDAAGLIWQWILNDPEAKQWLGGTPDPWGMKVNPNYETDLSTSVLYGLPSLDQFKKADPYCYQTGIMVGSPPVLARPLCMQDWTPYVNTMHDAAADVRNANSGAATEPNLGASDASLAWSKNGPQVIGERFLMSVTDTASATRYGLQTAALSRAGDDGTSRAFVVPDTAGLAAGEQAMTTSQVPGVRLANPATTASGAYPLTELTYAAVMPEGLDQTARRDYSAFITYAVGAGQQPGSKYGQLPEGFVSLPPDLVTEATQAASAILNPPPPTSTTTTAPAPTPTTQAPAVTAAAPVTTISEAPTVGAGVGSTAPVPVTSSHAAVATTSPPTAGPSPTIPAATATSQPAVTSRGRSASAHAGEARLALPLALLVGLLAAGGAFALAVPRGA
jgi:hypothetical protein